MEVNLKECEEGDILICKTGAILEYISPTEEGHYYDHKIKYLFVPNSEYDAKNLGDGTRIDDGHVYRKNRLDGDHDVVAVIPRSKFNKIFKNKK